MASGNHNISTFTKLLPISIRKEFNINMRDLGGGDGGGSRQGIEQKETIRVTVLYPSPSCGAMNPHKEIALRLTNDENPSFFYYLRICDTEFPDLKSHQGLLVDFHGFPQQLLSLLERCDPNSDESSLESGPKFLLVLKIGSFSVLDIVESNPFKYLCHLSLQINPGSDADVKKYLCDVTTALKKDLHHLEEKYNHLVSSMTNEVDRNKILLDEKTQEINQLRHEIHSQTNTLSTKHFQEMTGEKEKLLKLQSDLANKFEQERTDLDRRHGQVVLTLEDRITSLETENRDLIQCKYKNETALQDAMGRLKSYEDDLKIMQQEITLTRKQNGKLDHDYHEKQRTVNSLQNRLTTLEADLKEKHHVVIRQQDHIGQLSEQKKFLEDQSVNLVKEIDKLKSVNKSISTELIKANEIIKKLQDDIRSMHTKNKLQHQITVEQDRNIQESTRQIQNLESEVAATKSEVNSKTSELEQYKNQQLDSERKMEELEKNAKSNENMIAWLNKQLNEFQGLSNLSKFRQNLAQNNNVLVENGQDIPDGERYSTPLQAQLSQMNMSSANNNAALRKPAFFSRLQNSNQNGQTGQSQNSMGATPSWMHIYQSTTNATPQDDDLSSRLEQVTASQGLNHNLSNNKSRLDTISEKSVSTKPSNSASSVRPPTWAKGRGKVTLEGPVTVGRPSFRNRNNK